jgi:protease II
MSRSLQIKVTSEVAVVPAIDPASPHVVVRPRGQAQYFVEHHDGWLYVLATKDGIAGNSIAGETHKTHTHTHTHTHPHTHTPAGSFNIVIAFTFFSRSTTDRKFFFNSAAGGGDIGNHNDTFCLARVCASDPSSGAWEHVADPPPGCAIEDADFFDTCVVLHLRNDRGLREFQILPYDGISSSTNTGVKVQLPSADEVAAVTPGANSDASACVFSFSSSTPLVPLVEWEISLPGGELRRVREVPCPGAPHFASSSYVTQRRFYSGASDGDPKVPLTVTHRVEHSNTVGSPTLIIVYGAYGEPLEPHFDAANVCLLRRGWVVAHCHARGGGELGRSWHDAARVGRKEHTAEDLRAAIAGLVDEGLADPERVVCLGASAGGLAVAMLCVRDPRAMAGAVLRVPYVDMLTSLIDKELPLTAHEWDEWGDPSADEGTLAYLQSVCPYYSLGSVNEHPSVLATASTKDKRVQFWHPAKYVARLRALGIAGGDTANTLTATSRRGNCEAFLLASDDSGHFGGGGADHLALEIAFMHRATSTPLR